MLSATQATIRARGAGTYRNFTRVRFRSRVGPDVKDLQVLVRATDPDGRSYEFGVMADGVLACTGSCKVGGD